MVATYRSGLTWVTPRIKRWPSTRHDRRKSKLAAESTWSRLYLRAGAAHHARDAVTVVIRITR